MFGTPVKVQQAANYREVQDYLTRGVPFRHRSISAEYVSRPAVYTVKSYDTVVATWAEDGAKWITDHKYSATTSKQVNYIRKAWSL